MTTNKRIHSIMLHKINKALNNDQPVTVSFINKYSLIAPGGVKRLHFSQKVVNLNDSFVDACRKQAAKRKKATASVILEDLYDMNHDYNSQYFMIS